MQNPAIEKQNRNTFKLTVVFIFSVGLMLLGTAGFFIFQGSLAGYLLAHIGALGVTGILAWLTGLIARKKGREFRSGFLVGLIVPPALGILAALSVFYIARVGTSIACGGSVSLSISILLILGYSVARSKGIVGA